MAHGQPRLYVCKPCDQIIKISRFSDTPKCTCGRNPIQVLGMAEVRRMTQNMKLNYPGVFDTWIKL